MIEEIQPETMEYVNSVGLEAIVNVLQEWSNSRNSPKWDTTIVNVLTLIRNNFTKDDSVDAISNRVVKDMDMLAFSISAYHQNHNKLFTPYILYYLPDYSAIPKPHRREESETRYKINQICNRIKEKIQHTEDLFLLSANPIASYFAFVGNGYAYPHQHVVDRVKYINNKLDTQRVSSLQRKYVLLSHCPLDFHMWSKIPFKLFETYTGKMKDYKELGPKVFKVPHVPFNKYTHILFGDSIHIKPVIQRKIKKSLIDLAHKDRWYAKGDEAIKLSITNYDSSIKLFINNLSV